MLTAEEERVAIDEIDQLSPAYLLSGLHRTHKGDFLSWDDHAYLEDIYADSAPQKVIKKSTQCGVSEYLICLAIGNAKNGRNVFYVFPTWQLMNRFVHDRLDMSILYTELYQQLLTQANRRGESGSYRGGIESTSLKRFGRGSLVLVGSGARAPFTEYPADQVIVDELDECNQSNVAMVDDRLAHSNEPGKVQVGNPTVQGRGIDVEYRDSDQRVWMTKCEHCGTWQNFDFFKHVVRHLGDNEYAVLDQNFEWHRGPDARLFCEKCGKPLDRFAAGEWVARYPGHSRHGYHISKLFSTRWEIRYILERFNRGQNNVEVLQRFYNADLGVAYEAPGSKITEEMLNACIGDHMMGPTGQASIIGIDVGTLLHYAIGVIDPDSRRTKITEIGEVSEERELLQRMREHNVRAGIIDAQPEIRMARRFVRTWPGMFACYQQNVKYDNVNRDRRMVTVNRTSQLDTVMEALSMQEIVLPRNVKHVADFYPHMTAATRVYEPARDEYVWSEGSQPDHYHHAMAFLYTARRMLASASGRK